MKNYCWYFSNDEELMHLIKEGKIEEVEEVFGKSQLQRITVYSTPRLSAAHAFNKLVEFVKNKGTTESFAFICKRAMRMFADVWYVQPLLSARANRNMKEMFDAEVNRVLVEYDEYRLAAVSAWDNMPNKTEWEVKYNESVVLRRHKDELSFYRNGEKYIIYYSDDKYYTETTSA